MEQRFEDTDAAWYCARSKPKHERIAAVQLRDAEQIQVFVPQIRFRRPTSRGPIWVTEALFPSYFFVRFSWRSSLRRVCHSPGVSGIVHFGEHWPTIPAEMIDQLRSNLGPEEVHLVRDDLSPGDEVRIAGGTFHGFKAMVVHLLPSAQRVAVLMDFLGRQTTVQLNRRTVIRDVNERELIRERCL